mmetsp:Transcript_12799/g.38411  ORF Transcript_12799/g.38411 Transcript_12799/m.38411 type:complete len:237 (-) Transcript_12799:2073-2783(-)
MSGSRSRLAFTALAMVGARKTWRLYSPGSIGCAGDDSACRCRVRAGPPYALMAPAGPPVNDVARWLAAAPRCAAPCMICISLCPRPAGELRRRLGESPRGTLLLLLRSAPPLAPPPPAPPKWAPRCSQPSGLSASSCTASPSVLAKSWCPQSSPSSLSSGAARWAAVSTGDAFAFPGLFASAPPPARPGATLLRAALGAGRWLYQPLLWPAALSETPLWWLPKPTMAAPPVRGLLA